MKRFGVVATLVAAAWITSLVAQQRGEAMFDAVAELRTPQGTRSLACSISVTKPMSIDETGFYRDLLAKGGQQSLYDAIRGLNRGNLHLGAVQWPLSVVVSEKTASGWKYAVVSARNLSVRELEFGEPTLDYPFAVATFEVPDMGRGEGQLVPRAALRIDADGRLAVEKYEGEIGRLKDIKRR